MASEHTPLINPLYMDPSSNEGLVYDDEPHHMTLSRRIARYLSMFPWYNPHLKSTSPLRPNIDQAWAYFEHFILARHYVPSKEQRQGQNSGDYLRKAEPGESDRPTRLYSVFHTPEIDLCDWGIGVGVYFFTLRSLCIIMFLAGLINVPALIYYASDAYSGSHDTLYFRALQTSAICTDSTWVPCPTCTREHWNSFPSTLDRFAETQDGLTFILRNNCKISSLVAVVSYISLLFVCISVLVLHKITKRRERFFDEASQTTTDYAVEVVNPPKDARDINEWHDFFSMFGHVTCCTVALDNEELIAALVQRRELLVQLESLQPAGVYVDRHANISIAMATAEPVPWYLKLIGTKSAETIQAEIEKLDTLIQTDLALRHDNVSNVFVIFETEKAQQKALKQLACLDIDKLRNNTNALPSDQLFRGNTLLAVKEPPEPSSVRWKDLDETVVKQLTQRFFIFWFTLLIIVASSILVTYMRLKHGIFYAALTVSAINSIAPMACGYVTEYESHSNEGEKQASLYYKITACLWVNTAIITAFITPFADTLEERKEALIPAMMAIFITELFKSPVVQLLDVGGHIKRHVLGPRAVDQKRMNAYFQGTSWLLSERYTDMTNILFLTFYYGFVFPAGFFFASATLAVHYWVDKFCLLRVWAPAPMLGSEIADRSRVYFFSASIAVYAIMSSYNYASFPYDNACVEESTVSSEYIGSFQAMTASGTPISVDVSQGDSNYFYCSQDMMHWNPPAFPAIPSKQPVGGEWMSSSQDFCFVFGWTSVFIVVYVVGIFLNTLRKWLAPIFFRVYERHTSERESEPFSKIPSICAYVPQMIVPGHLFPVLLCDVSTIDPELVGWEDPKYSYKEHSVIYDLPGLSERDVFSVIRQWPPPATTND